MPIVRINTITVDNRSELALGLGQVDTHKLVLTDGGVLNVASRDYVFNSDLNNARYITNDSMKSGDDYDCDCHQRGWSSGR